MTILPEALMALLTIPAAAQTPSAAAVQASTRPASAPLATDLYRSERLRDPFVEPRAGGGTMTLGAVAAEPAEFSIHALALKGILGERSGGMALLIEPVSGATYILRSGRLYDYKNKPVPGVTGAVLPRQKTVRLQTPDKDVQTFILGEEEGL